MAEQTLQLPGTALTKTSAFVGYGNINVAIGADVRGSRQAALTGIFFYSTGLVIIALTGQLSRDVIDDGQQTFTIGEHSVNFALAGAHGGGFQFVASNRSEIQEFVRAVNAGPAGAAGSLTLRDVALAPPSLEFSEGAKVVLVPSLSLVQAIPVEFAQPVTAGFAARLTVKYLEFQARAQGGMGARLSVLEPTLHFSGGGLVDLSAALAVENVPPTLVEWTAGGSGGLSSSLTLVDPIPVKWSQGATGGLAAELGLVQPVELRFDSRIRMRVDPALTVNNLYRVAMGSAGGMTALLVDFERIDLDTSFTAGTSGGMSASLAPLRYPGDLQAALGRGARGGVAGRLEVRNPGSIDVTMGTSAAITARLDVAQRSASAIVAGAAPMVGWLLEIDGIGNDGTVYRVWSGFGDLEFDDVTWSGTQSANGAWMAISPVTDEIGAPVARAQVSIAVPSSVVIDMLEIDVGPAQVFLSYIYSQDHGRSWVRSPVGLAGQLSQPQFEDGVYTVEIETYAGDADRGAPRVWSHETQQAEHPGDLGFQFMRALSQGVEAKWPP